MIRCIKYLYKNKYYNYKFISNIYNLFQINKKLKGEKNKINIDKALIKNLKINIIGNNNLVSIGENTYIKNSTIIVKGDNHKLIIGNKCNIKNSIFWFEDNNCLISIGDKTTSEGFKIASIEPNSKVQIGRDCMFSHDIEIRTGDSHEIIDINTNDRINNAKSIKIKEHVWIGAYVKILKGVCIGNNAIVGLGSIVTHDVSNNTINTGVPSKEIRKDVDWNR